MGKLVRDRIPDIIRASAGDPKVRALDDEQFASALKLKLAEECDELSEARDDLVLDEAADVLEVVLAMLATHGHDLDALLRARDVKRTERGGFDDRVWLAN